MAARLYLRDARLRANLSQVELAKLIGTDQPSVSDWERGATFPSADTLLRLAGALKVSLNDLLRDETLPDIPHEGDPALQARDAV